jgi:hypothetical protein
MLISRRELLKATFFAATVAPFISTHDVLASLTSDSRAIIVGSDKSVCLINFNDFSVKRIELGFPPHGFVQHPDNPNQFVVVQKWGPGCASVDFSAGKVISQMDNANLDSFYGHGVYDPKTKNFFVTRVNKETKQGHLIGYEGKTFKKVADYQVTPGGLHDCHFLKDGRFVLASTGMQDMEYESDTRAHRVEKSALVMVDLSSGKVIDKAVVEDDDQILSHFTVLASGEIIALCTKKPLSQARHGEVYFSKAFGQPFEACNWKGQNEKMRGEMLSAAVNKDETLVAITNPGGPNIVLIDIAKRELVSSAKASTRAIVYDADSSTFISIGNTVTDRGDMLDENKKIRPSKVSSKLGHFNSSHAVVVTV